MATPESVAGDSVSREIPSPMGARPLASLSRSSVRADDVVEAARAMLATLDERARRILLARFGIDSGTPQTLQAIGDTEKITRERVRQIEQAGLRAVEKREPRFPPRVTAVRQGLKALLESLGRAAREDTLLTAVGGKTAPHRAALRFLLSSLPGVTEARETQRTVPHWTVAAPGADETAGATLETILESAESALRSARHLLSDAEVLAAVRRAVPESVSEPAVWSVLSVGKRMVRTPFGEWGLKGWPEATPRGVGDKAYVVLKRAGKPLHFTAVAQGINLSGFDLKRAHPQTVHNELIRNERFVLVGRGLYGLREWGFEPGTVADVMERILKKAERPLPKPELVAAVLKQRLVKRNTVLLALQDEARFRPLPDGTVALAAAAPPLAAPEPSRAPTSPLGPPPAL